MKKGLLIAVFALAAPLAHAQGKDKGKDKAGHPGAAPPAAAEKALAPAAGPAEETARGIEAVGKMLLEMVEDKEYPEAKLDYKPTPEVRSFAEQVLHATKANMIFLEVLEGKKPDFGDLPRANYKTRADLVKALRQSIDDLAALARKLGDAGIRESIKHPFAPRMASKQSIFNIPAGHMMEHYGQLVIYYRLNKLVPPASRKHEHG